MTARGISREYQFLQISAETYGPNSTARGNHDKLFPGSVTKCEQMETAAKYR